jgi:hypothetical protein
VEDGPIPSVHGVVRWRIVDLMQWLWEEFRLSGATAWEISARCRAMAAVVQRGSTRAAPLASAGQMAPKM